MGSGRASVGGRQLDFYATDQEVATRLSEMPQETGRYELIGRLFDDHERAWLAWCAPIRDTGAVLYSTGDPGAIGLCPLMTDPREA